MQQRPISVTIFGILNIGFGLLGIVGLLFTSVVMSSMNMAAGNPVLKEMYGNPAYQTWMKMSIPLGGLFSIALIAGGIGLLFLQNWARIVSIIYGIFAILSGLVGGLVMLSVIMSITAHASPNIMTLIPLIGSVFGMVAGMVYPILLIIFMTRPKVVAAFRPAQPAA